MSLSLTKLLSDGKLSSIPKTMPPYVCIPDESIDAQKFEFSYFAQRKVTPFPSDVEKKTALAHYGHEGASILAIWISTALAPARLTGLEEEIDGCMLRSYVLALPENLLTITDDFFAKKEEEIVLRPREQKYIELVDGEEVCRSIHCYEDGWISYRKDGFTPLELSVSDGTVSALGRVKLDVKLVAGPGECPSFEYSVIERDDITGFARGVCFAGTYRIEMLGRVFECVCVADVLDMNSIATSVRLHYFAENGRMVLERSFSAHTKSSPNPSGWIDGATLLANGQVLHHTHDTLTDYALGFDVDSLF